MSSSMFSKNGFTSGRGSFHPGAHLTSPFAQTMRKYNCYLKAKRVRPKQLKHVKNDCLIRICTVTHFVIFISTG